MFKKGLNLFVIVVCILFLITNASSVSSDEQEINSRVDYVNSQIKAISNSFATEDIDTSTGKLVDLNDRLSRELTSLYNDIVKVREENPSFTPNQIIEYPDNLKASYYKNLDNQLRETYYKLKDEYSKAKFDHGLVKFKTAMAIVLNAAIMYDGAMGLVGSGASDSKSAMQAVKNVLTAYTVSDNVSTYMKKWHDVDEIKVLKNNIDALKEEGPRYEEYLKQYYSIKAELLEDHHAFSRMLNYLEQYMDEFKQLEILIENARKHINSASSAIVFDVNEVSFSSSQFTTAFDDLLGALQDEEISWNEYLSRKEEIYGAFQTIVYNIKSSGKIENYQDKINEVNEYYYSYDEYELNKRSEVYSDLYEKLKAWEVSMTDLIKYYNTLNFNDLEPVDIEPIKVEYKDDDGNSFNNPSTVIGANVGRYLSSSISIEPKNGLWYLGAIEHCEDVALEVHYIYQLADIAIESTTDVYKASEAFGVLLNGVNTMQDGLTNMRRYRDYLSNLPSYLDVKFDEILKVRDYLEDVNDVYNEIINLEEENSFYITEMDFLNTRVYNRKGNIKLKDNYLYFLDTEKVLNYISNELDDIEVQSEDVFASCYNANDDVKNTIYKQEDFIAFVNSFDNEVSKLESKMKSHMEFLSVLRELKDYHQVYESLSTYQSRDEIQGNYDMLKSYYNKFLNYEDVNDFIAIQDEIKELKSYVKSGVSSSQVGFYGDFAVLDESRESVQKLLDMSFYFGGYYTAENIKSGIPEIQKLLDSDGLAQTHVNDMSKFVETLKFDYEQILFYEGTLDARRSFFLDAQSVWLNNILQLYAKTDGFEKDSVSRYNYEEAKKLFIKIVDEFQHDVEEQFRATRWIPDESMSNPMDSVLLELYSGQLESMGLGNYLERWNELQDNRYSQNNNQELMKSGVPEWAEKWNYGFDFSFGNPEHCDSSCYDCDTSCYDCSSGECYSCQDSCYSCHDGCYNPESMYGDSIDDNYDDNYDWFAWASVWDSAYDYSDGHGADHCGSECYECETSCYDCSSGECFVCDTSCYDCDASCFDPDFSGWDEYGKWLGPNENQKDHINNKDKDLEQFGDHKDDDELELVEIDDSQNVEELKMFLEQIQIGLVLPNFVPYSDEVFNIYTAQGNDVGFIELKNKTITSFDYETSNDYTYQIYIKNREIIEDIVTSSSPLDVFNKYKSNGDIQIKAKSIRGKIKTGIISLVSKIAGWFM